MKIYQVIFCQSGIYNLVTKKFNKTLSKLNTLPYPIDFAELKANPKYFSSLLDYTYFIPKKGPIFEVKCGRIRMDNKANVKNIINLVYEIVPQILAQSIKNSTVKKISLNVEKSKDLPIYENDFVVELN